MKTVFGVLVGLSLAATLWAYSDVLSPGLVFHREYADNQILIKAICDEGNGTMLYVTYNHRNWDTHIAAVPGGCHR